VGRLAGEAVLRGAQVARRHVKSKLDQIGTPSLAISTLPQRHAMLNPCMHLCIHTFISPACHTPTAPLGCPALSSPFHTQSRERAPPRSPFFLPLGLGFGLGL
jgi:hypothetical protein